MVARPPAANNAPAYPGIGLGTIVAQAGHVTDGMLLVAARAIADLVDVDRPGAAVLSDVRHLRATSATVAVAVARRAAADGVAPELDDPVSALAAAMWRAAYPRPEVR